MLTPDQALQKLRTACRESERAVTVIFGAGASRGYSRNNHPYSPPIVSQLFNLDNAAVATVLSWQKHSELRGMKAVIERGLRSFGGDLEKYLSDIYGDNKDHNLFALMIVYLQDLFEFASNDIDLDDNNYKSIATAFHNMRGKRPYHFLTFNYDTLLEQSISALPIYRPQRRFLNATDYKVQNPIVTKMHGSINFRYEFETEIDQLLDAHDVFMRMMTDPSEDHNVLAAGNSLPSIVSRIKDAGLKYSFPLMLIPVHEAVSPENGYFKKKIGEAKECISNSSLVIAIGYNFGDEQFLNALKGAINPDTELILVGTQAFANDPTNHPSYVNVSKVWPLERILVFNGDGFQAFTDSL